MSYTQFQFSQEQIAELRTLRDAARQQPVGERRYWAIYDKLMCTSRDLI